MSDVILFQLMQIKILISSLQKEILVIINEFNTNYMENKNPVLFSPVEEDVIAKIDSDKISLKSLFWINKTRNQKVPVILTKNYVVLCQEGDYLSNVYLQYVRIDFDLKFQIIYEGNQPYPNHANQPISKKKIGFRLLKNSISVEFEITCQNMIDIWIKSLTRYLSQRQFLKHFKIVRRLGRGAYAFVYEVERLTDRKHFAAKAFFKYDSINSSDPQRRLAFRNEINMMKFLENPNIVKIKGIYESENEIYLLLEYLPVGLHNLINKREGKFSHDQTKKFILELAEILKYMHENRIMHRDLNPNNIMMRFRDSISPVVIDLGFSADSDSDDYIYYKSGTPGYISPQIFTLQKGMKIQPVCDIFSLGAIFHILLTRNRLFTGESREQILFHNRRCILNWNLPMYKDVSPWAMDLLEKMLKKNPKQRITAAKIINHPYLKKQVQQKEDITNESISPSVTNASKKEQQATYK